VASVYKPTRIDPKTGARIKYRCWRIAYEDEDGRRRTKKGFRDKSATEALARHLEREVERRKAGLTTGEPNKAVEEALDAYLAELRRLGRSTIHVYGTERQLRRLVDALGWQKLRDIRPDRLSQHLGKLHDEEKSPRTQNAARDAAVSFCAFCKRQGWVLENVLAIVPQAKIGERRPRRRRALSPDEFRALVKLHAQRGTIYRAAGLSGLRREELRQVELRDFVLGEQPQWRLRPEITKGKRFDAVPMLPECAELLAQLAEGKKSTDRLFGKVPRSRTFNKDLESAKIPKRDERGRQADFHSLRYFFCTLLARELPIQVVRLLMRHRDIRQTCNLYLDLGLTDVNEAVVRLPRLLPKNGQGGV
jgi:integrase